MKKLKVGLLPLYVELYDIACPEVRPDIDAAHENTIRRLREQGLEVVTWPVCRLAAEFSAAIAHFEAEQVDGMVTLHLAYSPSLESEKALAATELPIVILDTTPEYVYDQHTPDTAEMLNHGIHGVQDMCNLLIRNGKKFTVCAGHMDHSDVLERVVAAVRVARVAKNMRNARVGLVGNVFAGMGDFRVDFAELKKDLGVEVVPYDWEKGGQRVSGITQTEIDAEYEKDSQRFIIPESISRKVYDLSARTALGIRKWVEQEQLTGFSINFMDSSSQRPGLPVMPFTECCTAMENGIGYAGEGDVLTAAFTGALLSAYPETTFAEMFCPDWAHGAVFLSHMGEFNYAIAKDKPVMLEKDFPFTDAENPTAAYQTMKGGRAVFLNLAPFGNGRYSLILAPGQMLHVEGENNMNTMTNGWFKPDVQLERFLERFSQAGATHHGVLVYGDVLEELIPLADRLGCKCVVIKE